jgi:uncharacterized repeat protein (TIGR03803 family)
LILEGFVRLPMMQFAWSHAKLAVGRVRSENVGRGFADFHNFIREVHILKISRHGLETDVFNWPSQSGSFMKTTIQKLSLLSLLMTGLNLMPADQATAQNYNNVHVFNYPNDGANPQAGLIVSGNTLYGTTSGAGGQSGAGTVFKVNTDGSNPTNFYSFTLPSFPNFPHTNSDGAFPAAGVVLSGNTVYGTTYEGGVFGYGTVYRVNTDGSDFTNMHSFTAPGFNAINGDGINPLAGLALSGNRLYGTASQGGTNGGGTVFSINTDGSHFTNLYNFTGGNDGGFPSAGLVLSGNTLYGTTANGGTNGNGALFAINTDGSDFTNLYSFSAGDLNDEDDITNSDGGFPEAALILSGNTLYGTSSGGGLAGVGTVFAINTDGSGFTNLYSFTDNGPDNGTNSDGAIPLAGLLLAGNTLYGTANEGGAFGFGTVFAINTDGSDFTNLFDFNLTVNDIGGFPYGGLVASGGALYGTTFSGGFRYGVVFGLSNVLPALPSAPVLTIALSGTNVILTWPANVGVFNLQSTTNLASPNWITISGQNTVTNPISTIPQKFFRLSQ